MESADVDALAGVEMPNRATAKAKTKAEETCDDHVLVVDAVGNVGHSPIVHHYHNSTESRQIPRATRSQHWLYFLSPTTEVEVGAATCDTVYARLRSVEYLVATLTLVSFNVYGFTVLRCFCDKNPSPLLDYVAPPLPFFKVLGSHGYDIMTDPQWAAFAGEVWVLASLGAGLGVGSYICRYLARCGAECDGTVHGGGNRGSGTDDVATMCKTGKDVVVLAASTHMSTSTTVEHRTISPALHESPVAGSGRELHSMTSPNTTLSLSTSLSTFASMLCRRLTGAHRRFDTHWHYLHPLLYAVSGVIFITIVHGPHFFLPLIIIFANYAVFTRLQRWCPYWLFMTIMWSLLICLLYAVELSHGFEVTYWLQYFFPTSVDSTIEALGPDNGRKGLWETRLRWCVAFRMTVLRLIAFNYDLWEATHIAARARERATLRHNTACIECAQLREANSNNSSSPHSIPEEAVRCYKYRTECPRELADYDLLHYIAYLLFPPLYLAGPMSSFNAFVSYMRVPSRGMPPRAMLIYAVRLVGIKGAMVALQHYLFIPTLSAHGYLIVQMTVLERTHFFFYSLTYIWLKFAFIWKTSRLFAMMSGIEVPEDIIRCFCNTLTIQQFWRDWHASFNLWIVRYMYIPMGGSRTKFLSILPIFFFIAIWHDSALHLLKWALCIVVLFMLELAVSAAFGAVSRVFCAEMRKGMTAVGMNRGEVDGGELLIEDAMEDGVPRPASASEHDWLVVLLRPLARFSAQRLRPRARAWMHRMLRSLAAMCAIFGLVVANLVGYAMQNDTELTEKLTMDAIEADADKSIPSALQQARPLFVAGLLIAMFSIAVAAAINHDTDRLRVHALKTHYGMA